MLQSPTRRRHCGILGGGGFPSLTFGLENLPSPCSMSDAPTYGIRYRRRPKVNLRSKFPKGFMFDVPQNIKDKTYINGDSL